MAQKPYWEQTVEEIACGRCDADEAGPGAATATYRDRLIVACASCLRELGREAQRRARRDAQRRRP